MSYHEHMGTIIQSESDIERFLDNTNNETCLLFDTGHLLFANANYEHLLKKYISRINHVHFKDIRKNILDESLNNNLSISPYSQNNKYPLKTPNSSRNSPLQKK